MIPTNINAVKLQQAIIEYGSLQAAIEVVKSELAALESEKIKEANKLELIKNNEEQGLDNIKLIENKIEQRKQELRELEEALENYKQVIDEYMTNNKQLMRQYNMVENLVAMLRTSPSERERVQELAGTMILLSDSFWKYSQQPHKLRQFFVQTVLGSYLYCYHCGRCGLKFIANQEVKSQILGYHCPNCGFMSRMKPDDSFLKAMLSSSEPPNDNETQEQEV